MCYLCHTSCGFFECLNPSLKFLKIYPTRILVGIHEIYTYHTISHGMLVQWSPLHLWKSLSVSTNWYGVISVKQKIVCKWVSIVCYFLYNKKSGRNKKVYLLIFAKGILERETRNHRPWKFSGQVDGNRVEWMRKWYSWVTFLYSFDFLEPCLCHILNKYTNALINN